MTGALFADEKKINPKREAATLQIGLSSDVTIELGRRMKSVRKVNTALCIEVSWDKSGLERMDFTACTILHCQRSIGLWEDGLAWLCERNRGVADFQCYAQFAELSAYEVADIIRSSLLDLAAIKNVWVQHTPKTQPLV